MIVRGTQSCTYNKCIFCYMSQGFPFKFATLDHMESEILLQKDQLQPRPKVFIVGSNPFTLSSEKLAEYIEVLRKHCPDFTELSMHSRISDVAKKSDEELCRLRDQGLGHLYVGTENGNDEALRVMNKGQTAAEAAEQLHRLTLAGIEFTTQYIIGMAGRGKGLESGLATAKFTNEVRPRRVMPTGLTVFPGTTLLEMVRTGEFAPATEKEKIEEMLCFFKAITVDTLFDAIHYLNPLYYRFRTGDIATKNKVIKDIEELLANHTEEEIEEMVGRDHMHSL